MEGRWLMFGKFGDEQNFYADTLGNMQVEIGTKMVLPDGRTFRAADAGGSTLVPGNWLQQMAAITNHVTQTAAAVAAGATAISGQTIGATALDYDLYRNGMIVIQEGGTGKSFAYPVASHTNYAASATTVSIPLQTGSSVVAAINTSDKFSLIASPWHNVIQGPATTLTAAPAGVCLSAAVTNGSINASGGNAKGVKLGNRCWVQTGGLAAVLAAGTNVIGEPSAIPTGTAGASGPFGAGAAETSDILGWTAFVAGSTKWDTIFVMLDI